MECADKVLTAMECADKVLKLMECADKVLASLASSTARSGFREHVDSMGPPATLPSCLLLALKREQASGTRARVHVLEATNIHPTYQA